MDSAIDGCPTPQLSIVTTLYNTAAFVREFHRRMSATAKRLTERYEIIFVNDGSLDDSLALALGLRKEDSKVKVVDLSRNFGQHKAMVTGLAHARGELVFQIDSDLEEEPELLVRFHEELSRSAADVVYATQTKRQGSLCKRLSGAAFYTLVRFLSSYPVPSNPLNARLMTRRYVDSLLLHREREVYMAGLWAITGYRQVAIPALKHSRGDSSYTLARKLSLMVNAITAFSNRPLYFVFWIGLAIMTLAAGSGLALFLLRLFWCDYLTGWTSLILSVWLLGGGNIFCMGIMSIYLSKVFLEVKQRPYSIVRHLYDGAAIDGETATVRRDIRERVDAA
ncbi:glycosyl transferase [Planctomycetaceae bacterium SCGC AG-212-D15]|nr:glycosyl transferase [Planctomycetaceae bacterium SCGC AG-212-D15]